MWSQLFQSILQALSRAVAMNTVRQQEIPSFHPMKLVSSPDRPTTSAVSPRRSRSCAPTLAGSAAAVAASFLLPFAASAVPIQSPGARASVQAPAGSPAMAAGPRRPGVIPSTSLSRDSGSNSDLSSGPRRPVPGQNDSLTAER